MNASMLNTFLVDSVWDDCGSVGREVVYEPQRLVVRLPVPPMSRSHVIVSLDKALNPEHFPLHRGCLSTIHNFYRGINKYQLFIIKNKCRMSGISRYYPSGRFQAMLAVIYSSCYE